MGKEILHKAKRMDTNEWVEGYYVKLKLTGTTYILTGDAEVEPCKKGVLLFKKYEVDPKTICQYTGLTDKNGLQKIFEGDIVSAPFMGYSGKTEIRKGVIEFVKGTFSVNWNDSEEYGKNFAGYVNDIEVIGNIFDNPELLRGA